jgi:ATP-binding cassette, subfamily F, member 3
MLVRTTDLRHAYGDRVTLDGVSFTLEARDRVALTGRNGAGKTTLLRILTGELRPESGELEFAPETRVGYLEQDPEFLDITVRAVMRGALNFVTNLEAKLRDLETRLESDTAALGDWSATLEMFERAGGYAAESKAAQVMAALELTEFAERDAGTLSGGERTRLALAAALVNQPDVLILDEPTNHLDIRMREWLERSLLDYAGAVLIVSHDRKLLDAVCQQTFHLERGQLSVFAGGYTKSRLARMELRRVQKKQHREGSFELRRLDKAGKQVAAWGINNDKLARRAKALKTRAERTRESIVEAPARERRIVMSLQSSDTKAETMLRAEHLTKTYADKTILEDAGLRIRAGDRVALLAPNGAGKTTLLRMLLAEVAPDATVTAPEIRYADGAVAVHFDQTYHGLNPNRAVIEQLSDRVGEGAARALLGRYGFRTEDWYKRPRQLSGGERARAGLALIAATRADVLLLDEPTNHLDVETLETLEDALMGYPGSLLFVTHDRAFAKNVATRVFGIEHGKLLEYPDGFEGYERARRGERLTLDPARLFEHELEPIVETRSLTLDQNIQLLEERLAELEELFLHRIGLTERDWARLRAERTLARGRLETLYAQKYAAPQEFDFVTRFLKQEIRAMSDENGGEWRFWMRGSQGCPSLSGRLEGNLLTLTWLETSFLETKPREMLPWFSRALLGGAIAIAFERIAAGQVTAPDGTVRSSLEYAAALKLLRPEAPRMVSAKRNRNRRKRKPSAEHAGTNAVLSSRTEAQISNKAPAENPPRVQEAARTVELSRDPAIPAKKKRRRRRKPRAVVTIA